MICFRLLSKVGSESNMETFHYIFEKIILILWEALAVYCFFTFFIQSISFQLGMRYIFPPRRRVMLFLLVSHAL